MAKPKITDVRHPFYAASLRNWRKWRLAYEGGERFIHNYLKRFSKREDDADFMDRRFVTYNPAYAKKAINEVKNTFFQRMVDVARVGGDVSYHAACEGMGAGVDLLGSSMNAFIGKRLLPELLTMSRVGVYLDMPALDGPTKADIKGKQPYAYWYPAEDICSWRRDEYDNFTEVLLIDSVIEACTDEFYLPYDEIRRYRHIWINDDGYVTIQLYGDDDKGEPLLSEPMTLGIRQIPFHIFELPDSLLTDAADYQIALLNLSSSDMAFLLKANFPFYVEQFDPRTQSQYLKADSKITQSTNPTIESGNFQLQVTHDKVHEVRVGAASGRKYPLGTQAPSFIHPSSEPLTASMAKQEQMKSEIRELVLGAVSQLAPLAGTSPGTEQADTGLEAGLAYIGLELQHGERMIAKFWASYMGGASATITYPESYELKTDEDRREEAADLELLMSKLPSKTYQKEIAKRMARVLLGPKVSAETLQKINSEIDAATVVTTDPEIIKSDFESGFVGLDMASKLRGYPAGEVERAKTDHADRIARIAVAQTEGAGAGGLDNPGARGVGDLAGDKKGGKAERKAANDTTAKETTEDQTRGKGK